MFQVAAAGNVMYQAAAAGNGMAGGESEMRRGGSRGSELTEAEFRQELKASAAPPLLP